MVLAGEAATTLVALQVLVTALKVERPISKRVSLVLASSQRSVTLR
jgi:hypothetical protein